MNRLFFRTVPSKLNLLAFKTWASFSDVKKLSVVMLRPLFRHGFTNWSTTCSPKLVAVAWPGPNITCHVMDSCSSHRRPKKSGFAGFDGIYCRNDTLPRYGNSCSSIVMLEYDRYCVRRFSFISIQSSEIGADLSVAFRTLRVAFSSNRMVRRIALNLSRLIASR